jgi:protoheme IX farnesyltransferase
LSLNDENKLKSWIKYFSISSTVSLFILIVFGGIIRANGSEGACLQWPTCFGIQSLPQDFTTMAAYLHRVLTFVVGFFQIALVILAFLQYRWKQLAIPYYISAVILLLQVVIGRVLSNSGDQATPLWVSSLHMGLSLTVLALMTIATTLAFIKGDNKYHRSINSRLSKLSLAVITSLLLLYMSGAVITRSKVSSICPSWPFCESLTTVNNLIDWINVIHRFTVALTGILLLILFIKAWKLQRASPIILVSTTAAFVLFLCQALLAAQMGSEFPVHQLIIHQSTAVAVWAAMVVQFSSAYISDFENAHPSGLLIPIATSFIGKMKDFFLLTKPIVVVLLLVTTYAGMVISSGKLPAFHLTFWTLLGGFMAAGGSGAINQYIDRIDDTKMQRTQKRPIPAGRLTPAEGLAFGTAMTLASFYVMVAFVNLPAALLTLAGIVYYVLIYSIFLKKTTVQNIVIGGGAGAIPPLVGWAAATGGINIPSLFLYAIVFMWTPPHFWALALVRRKDYARAGVPMLPVVRGEKETRWQIFVYTVELFVLTLLLPIFGLGGSIYMIGAILLGIWLLSAAWRVWKLGGNKSAWKMYRYSSMYLAFLFLALMLDVLL